MSKEHGERMRNMWIGEPGRGLRCVNPLTAQNLGEATLEASGELMGPHDTDKDAAVIPTDDAWAKGQSLDDKVSRSWDWWK